MLIYDCEIARAIPEKDGKRADGVAYCQGWGDFAGMGIACIVAYEVGMERYHVYLQDNLEGFQQLVDRHAVVVGYNAVAFDNRLCAQNGIRVPDDKTYDILVAIWQAAGLASTYQGDTHKGFGLGAVCEANLGYGKSGDGALAPVWYQQGRIGRMVSYCLDDVWLTAKLLRHMVGRGSLADPRQGREDVPAHWILRDTTVPLWIETPPHVLRDYPRITYFR